MNDIFEVRAINVKNGMLTDMCFYRGTEESMTEEARRMNEEVQNGECNKNYIYVVSIV